MIKLAFYHRAIFTETVSDRYADIVSKMQKIEPPLGWSSLDIPPPPEFESDELLAFYSIPYRDQQIRHQGTFKWRDKDALSPDHVANDDNMFIEFDSRASHIRYQNVLLNQFPEIASAFSVYRAAVHVSNHSIDFRMKRQQEVDALRENSGVHIDGRNNIFTLHPAQYWDAELCRRALGYGPDEVIRRLEGKVPLVRPLMDGVYTIFNDDPDLSFEQFCAINDRFKPVLGLA